MDIDAITSASIKSVQPEYKKVYSRQTNKNALEYLKFARSVGSAFAASNAYVYVFDEDTLNSVEDVYDHLCVTGPKLDLKRSQNFRAQEEPLKALAQNCMGNPLSTVDIEPHPLTIVT